MHHNSQKLLAIYSQLLESCGPQRWWPGETPFEVMVGAILTQSSAWTNVEKAIDNLKAAGVLSPQALRKLPENEIARLIHPSGYYNAKAGKLKAMVEWLHSEYGDIEKMSAAETQTLRSQLLSVHGIGPETADSILLYAAGKPVFVIDSYTCRIFSRLGFKIADKYEDYQAFFMNNLPPDAKLFNEYHALLVCHGKNICRTKPLCEKCCLKDRCKIVLQQ